MKKGCYHSFIFLFFLGLQLFSIRLFASEDCLDVNQIKQSPVILTEYVRFLVDPKGTLSLDDINSPSIAHQFQLDHNPTEAFNFGYTQSTYWFRLLLCNTSDAPLEKMIDLGDANLSNVSFYPPNTRHNPIIETGLTRPFASRPYENRFFVFPITLPPHSSQLYYLKLQSIHPFILPLKLWTPADFHQHERNDYFAQALYFGMVIAMIVFNALIFTVLRDTIYLLYVGYVAFFALYIAAITGLGKEFLWPNALNVDVFAAELCDFTIISLLFFTRQMLNTAIVIPFIDKLLKVYIVAYVLQSITGVIDFGLVINRYATFMHLTVALLILLSSILCSFKKQRNAYFFLFSFFMLFIGAVSMIFRVLGVLPTNVLTVSGFQYGSAWEMLILAFALADRFNSIRKEKEKIQSDLLQAQQLLVDNLKVSENILEIQVNERTNELQILNQTLNQKENYLRELIDNFPFMVWLKDTQSRFLAVNRALAWHYGEVHTDDLLGKTDFDFSAKEIAQLYRNDDLWVLQTKQTKIIEEKIVDHLGNTLWVETLRAPILDKQGNILGTVGFSQDISARKQFEADTQALNQSKSNFFANMSHEIRTPMNGIIGLSQLALKKEISAEVRNYLEKIYSSSNELLTIINSVLDFSKLESNAFTLDNTVFNLNVLLEKIDNLFEHSKQEANSTHFIIDVSADVPRDLIGDATKLRQVLINLLSNAKKFTHQGEIRTTITCVSQTHDTVMLCFSVRDTGIGITAQQIERLFQPFSQADSSITRNYGGTGLGLAICKQLVSLMGGEIHVSSVYGQGSTFEFMLTFVMASSQTALHPLSISSAFSPPHFPPHRVLLIEDNEINQIVAEELLTSMGLVVDIANNGKEGVERALATSFDLIFMDIQMPIMDGFTATQHIRAASSLQTIPIIAMTAHAMEGDLEKSLAAGMNAHLTKPIDTDQLVKVLSYWFGDDHHNTNATAVPWIKSTELPAFLPPFDLVAALAICNQNSTLLHQLLLNFKVNYSDTVNQLTRLIEEEAFTQAKYLAHSINGTAGTLGAHELKNAAAALELALHLGHREHLDLLLNTFIVTFNDAINATASLSEIQKPIMNTSLEDDDFNERLKQFKQAVSSNQFKAIDIFNELKSSLLSYNDQKMIDELEVHLEQLNFNEALRILDDIH
jgi:PAS domain S-box-containing protein